MRTTHRSSKGTKLYQVKLKTGEYRDIVQYKKEHPMAIRVSKGKPPKKAKWAAVLTIRDADKMTARNRKDIAAWLRNHARWVEKHGSEYSKTMRAGFNYYRV